jgi:hypothetical protein
MGSRPAARREGGYGGENILTGLRQAAAKKEERERKKGGE